MSRCELLVSGGRRVASDSVRAPGFDYPVVEVGVAGSTTILYDPSLGLAGLLLAQEVLGAVSGPYSDMQVFFDNPGQAVQLLIVPISGLNDGSGGAYHYFDSPNIIYVDATFDNTVVSPLSLEVALYVAELSECFMILQDRGWDLTASNGEGLSRFLAEYESAQGTFYQFYTVVDWAAAGFPDWVTKTEETDTDPIATGCAVAYLYWMVNLGFSIADIVQAGGVTLSENYRALTGRNSAYQDLLSAVDALPIASDNPFIGAMQVFYRGLNTSLYTRWRNPDGQWSSEQSLGGALAGQPAIAQVTGSNLLELVYRGTANGIYSFKRTPDGLWWILPLGGNPAGDPCIAPVPGTGVVQVFYRGVDNDLCTNWRNPDGTWAGESSLGGNVGGKPLAVRVPDVHSLVVLYANLNQELCYNERNLYGVWSGEQVLGSLVAGNLAAAQVPGTAVLQVFYRNPDNALCTRFLSQGQWAGEQNLGGTMASDPCAWPVPVTDILQVFHRGVGNVLTTVWREPGGTWTQAGSIGPDILGTPAAGRPPGTDALQVFYVGKQLALCSRWRNADGSWSVEQTLGGWMSTDPVWAYVPVTSVAR